MTMTIMMMMTILIIVKVIIIIIIIQFIFRISYFTLSIVYLEEEELK